MHTCAETTQGRLQQSLTYGRKQYLCQKQDGKEKTATCQGPQDVMTARLRVWKTLGELALFCISSPVFGLRTTYA